MNMDTMIKGIPMDIKELTKIINEIVNIDYIDDIRFEVLSSRNIRFKM